MNITGKTKIFLDSGNPAETKEVKEILGFLDGQTTNPSLVAKNPHIQELKSKGVLNDQVIWDEYKKVALAIHQVIPTGSISAEVFADQDTTHEEMVAKGLELNTWFPGIFVKLPITHEGLIAARQLVAEDVNVNMTLCFSQEQAAAVHEATIAARPGQVYISPFIGRLDDIGYHGIDLVKNIIMMYQSWESHVMVLGASIRGLEHLFECFNAGADIVTIPLSVAKLWSAYGVEKNPQEYILEISEKKSISYIDMPKQDWVLYNIKHELTEKGIEKFVEDWRSLFTV
jgi:transaldolase